MSIEVAVFSHEDAINALNTPGVSRIEVCINYDADGLTMPIEELREIQKHRTSHNIDTPVHAMIRPAPGSFCYNEAVFTQMKREVEERLDLCDGFVFGILDESDRVDVEHCRQLVELARTRGRACTFHRAVDCTEDISRSLKLICDSGFTSVLSSGLATSAAEGVLGLKDMISAGTGIMVIAGGGVRSDNVMYIMDLSEVQWVHTSARIDGKFSAAEIGRIRHATGRRQWLA